MKEKRYKDAARHLELVASANPNDPKLLEFLLEAQVKAKDKKGAKATKKRLDTLKK